jgi:hypothetical protein
MTTECQKRRGKLQTENAIRLKNQSFNFLLPHFQESKLLSVAYHKYRQQQASLYETIKYKLLNSNQSYTLCQSRMVQIRLQKFDSFVQPEVR